MADCPNESCLKRKTATFLGHVLTTPEKFENGGFTLKCFSFCEGIAQDGQYA